MENGRCACDTCAYNIQTITTTRHIDPVVDIPKVIESSLTRQQKSEICIPGHNPHPGFHIRLAANHEGPLHTAMVWLLKIKEEK